MECFEGGLFLPYNPWVHASEKSQAAERRERVVTEKFNNVKNEQERSLLENAKALLALGAQSESNSPLKLIPSTLICEILEFAQGEKKGNIGNDSNNSAGGSATSIPAVREDFGVNFSDMSMYTPGNKIVVPLTMPNTHLTGTYFRISYQRTGFVVNMISLFLVFIFLGPCWRDFSRAVRTHTGWNVKRIAATPEQKMQYGETRKGKGELILIE